MDTSLGLMNLQSVQRWRENLISAHFAVSDSFTLIGRFWPYMGSCWACELLTARVLLFHRANYLQRNWAACIKLAAARYLMKCARCDRWFMLLDHWTKRRPRPQRLKTKFVCRWPRICCCSSFAAALDKMRVKRNFGVCFSGPLLIRLLCVMLLLESEPENRIANNESEWPTRMVRKRTKMRIPIRDISQMKSDV